MNGIIRQHVELVKSYYPDAELTDYADGSAVLTTVVTTPPGWNKDKTRVWVVIPVGYPVAKPDCFWTEPDLRLHTGAQPMSTGFNPLPHHSGQFLWFSWHTAKWNPNKDSLLTYLHTVEQRLRDAR